MAAPHQRQHSAGVERANSWLKSEQAESVGATTDALTIAVPPSLVATSAAWFRSGTGIGDRKSTRLNSITNAHLVCRLLLEKKNQKNVRKHTQNQKEQNDNNLQAN